MAAKKGRGLLMVYVDVPAEVEDEFNRWYNEEHVPERLACVINRRARRVFGVLILRWQFGIRSSGNTLFAGKMGVVVSKLWIVAND